MDLAPRLDPTRCHFSSSSPSAVSKDEAGRWEAGKEEEEREEMERDEEEGCRPSGSWAGLGASPNAGGCCTHNQPLTVSTAGLPAVKGTQWRGRPVDRSLRSSTVRRERSVSRRGDREARREVVQVLSGRLRLRLLGLQSRRIDAGTEGRGTDGGGRAGEGRGDVRRNQEGGGRG